MIDIDAREVGSFSRARRCLWAPLIVLLTQMSVGLSGCGTLFDLADASVSGTKSVRVFGGVAWDVEFMQQSAFAAGLGTGWLIPLAVIDLPLSVILDILLLPVTIPLDLLEPNGFGATSGENEIPPTTTSIGQDAMEFPGGVRTAPPGVVYEQTVLIGPKRILVQHGLLVVDFRGRLHELRAGEDIVVPRGVPHAVENPGPEDAVWFEGVRDER